MGYYLNQTGRPIIYSCSWPAYEVCNTRLLQIVSYTYLMSCVTVRFVLITSYKCMRIYARIYTCIYAYTSYTYTYMLQ